MIRVDVCTLYMYVHSPFIINFLASVAFSRNMVPTWLVRSEILKAYTCTHVLVVFAYMVCTAV